jgi:hypothetical protein
MRAAVAITLSERGTTSEKPPVATHWSAHSVATSRHVDRMPRHRQYGFEARPKYWAWSIQPRSRSSRMRSLVIA